MRDAAAVSRALRAAAPGRRHPHRLPAGRGRRQHRRLRERRAGAAAVGRRPARPPLDRRRLRRPQGRAVRRGGSALAGDRLRPREGGGGDARRARPSRRAARADLAPLRRRRRRRSTSWPRTTRSFTFFTNEIRSPVQVTDLAQALLELAELDVSGPLHVAGADDVSRAEFAELIAGGPVRSAAGSGDAAARLLARLLARAGAAADAAPRRARGARLVLLEPLGDRLGPLRRALGERVDLGGGPLERPLHRPAHARLDPLREPVAEVLRLRRRRRLAAAPARAARRSRVLVPAASRPRSRARRRAPARRCPSAAARRAGRSRRPPAAMPPTSARVVSESRT